MPFHLSQIEDGKIIQIVFSGTSSLTEHEAARSSVAELCETTGCRRVLAHIDDEESFFSGSAVDFYEFAREFAEATHPHG